MRDELSLLVAQALSYPAAIGVALLGDGRAQYGALIAAIGFPFFMVIGALVQVPAFAYVRTNTRAGYLQFAIAGLLLGVLPAAFLVSADGGVIAGLSAAT
jgi:hypothetical protein